MESTKLALDIPWTRLPFSFAPGRLRAEAAAIDPAAWVAHFNKRDYEGQWSSIALRSRSGRANDILPVGESSEYKDTPVMEACPYLREVVATFDFPQKAVRLLRLHAGSTIREHVDRDLGMKDGELRIHVPVQTNDQVEFVVAKRRLKLLEGEAWYIDFSLPHRIANRSREDRIHLVIDGMANEWAEQMLERSAREIVTETFDPERIVTPA